MDKVRKLQFATDFYQFSVSNVYAADKKGDEVAVFDLFIRKNPFQGGYTVFAGLEQIIEFINDLHYSDEDIRLLKENHPEMTDAFLDCLRNLRFTGDIYAAREGELFFPQEPIVRVRAPLIQAQLIETTLLTIVNHESLIATKASRICESAKGDAVLDFGLRRAHGTEAGLYGARACMIGGCRGTSNVEAEYRWGTVSKGTMSHAYVMSYDDEYEAFEKFAYYNPDNIILLVDTYDTLKSGVVNAIKLFKNLKQLGKLNGSYGIRLDSGDLSYLSKIARKLLDDAGFHDAIISGSSDLDEYLIADLKAQGAAITLWGVGTKMITAYDNPALGAVYKLSEINHIPKMKISDAPEKITNPGYKKVIRLFDQSTGKAIADLITLEDETIDISKPLRIYHPFFTFKQRVITNFFFEEVLQCIFKNGKLIYQQPTLQESSEYHKHAKQRFWEENLRFVNPNEYHVDISDRLYDIKKDFIEQHNFKK
ncbi:MAG: nicotinate phosphoribosyltransferase [Anaerofustis sp.]